MDCGEKSLFSSCSFFKESRRLVKEEILENKVYFPNWNPHTLLVGIWNSIATLQNNLAVPQKVKHRVTVWPSNSTLRYIPKKSETYVHAKICTQMFIATLFIIAKKWKQPKYPSTDEWINKMRYFHTTEYISAIKNNEVLITQQHGWSLKTFC